MDTSPASDEKDFEQAFRVIGRHLDREGAETFTIRQIDDGFNVESRSPRSGLDVLVTRSAHFAWNRVGDLDTFYTGGRGLSRRAGKNESKLRKLGSMLKDDSGDPVTVTSNGNGLEVSIQGSSGNSTRSYTWDELQ